VEEKPRKVQDDDDKGRKDTINEPVVADKKKRGDDDDDDKGKDSRGDSIVIRRADYDDLRSRLDKMEGRIPGQLTDEDVDAFAKAQSRADFVYGHFGQTASRPMHGEKIIDYRRRVLKPMQDHSPIWKGTDLRVLSVDEKAFNNAEEQIFKAAVDSARSPSSVPVGTLREHVETRGGHTYHRFYGRPVSWMAGFAPNGRRIKRINQPGKGGHVDA
jgi:hypothetical protein